MTQDLRLDPGDRGVLPRTDTGPSIPRQPHGPIRFDDVEPDHGTPPRRRRLVALPTPSLVGAGWRRLTRFGVRPLLLGLDVLSLLVVLAGMSWASDRLGIAAPTREILTFGALLVGLLLLAGMYRSRLSLSVLDDFPVLSGRCLTAAGFTVVAETLRDTTSSQGVVIEWRFLWGAAATGVVLVVLRAVGYAVVRRLRARGRVAYRTLILGAGRVGVQVADVLQEHPEYGLRPVGFLDPDPSELDVPRTLPVLGGPERLRRMLETGGVRTVVVAFSSMKESEMVSLIRTCDRYSCELFVVPRLFELHQVESSMDTVWGFPLVRLRRATYRSRAWRAKRLADVLVAGLALLLLAPVLALIAVAVRLDSGPGILFGQKRVGVDGHHFEVLKFRSLRPATEAESATTWNIGDDPRLTRVGRFLRATSLDELPQLYNILRGDMSLVGPRPERPHFVDQFRSLYPSYEARHRVPSGLTGWAQVHGLRGDTSIADRARFDNYYIENWSLWLDVKIVLRTFSSVLRAAGR
ncbi:sugar transferase [Blastococcus sp. TF02A-35]|uniref:sugar transferase n=1 Tax=Blastococcus sp. TF02A-35 TaxID=2559612 RepID=UPI00107408E6|nr:sugar transferase [Blastococcus sp. TF02A_35]TFV53704.1 sugar transferase [Blastococcus sp. TF02A_35]